MLNIPDNSRTTYLFLTLCYLGAYLLLLSANIVSIGGSGLDRILWDIAHIPLYGGLAVLLYLYIGNRGKSDAGFFQSTRKTVTIAICIDLLDELSQIFIDDIKASLLDFFLDIIGVIVAVWIIHRLSAKRVEKKLLEGHGG